jgi:hypothetical protein
MSFKHWLLEYEGFNFSQEPDLVNGPQYPNSKYKGKGNNEEGERSDLPNVFDKISKSFGIKPNDPLVKIQSLMKKMNKKMGK